MESDLLALPPQDISHKLPKDNLLQVLGKMYHGKPFIIRYFLNINIDIYYFFLHCSMYFESKC